MTPLSFTLAREPDGRWSVYISDPPSAMGIGATPGEALEKALALRAEALERVARPTRSEEERLARLAAELGFERAWVRDTPSGLVVVSPSGYFAAGEAEMYGYSVWTGPVDAKTACETGAADGLSRGWEQAMGLEHGASDFPVPSTAATAAGYRPYDVRHPRRET